jgi:predicted transcriptional regulator
MLGHFAYSIFKADTLIIYSTEVSLAVTGYFLAEIVVHEVNLSAKINSSTLAALNYQ